MRGLTPYRSIKKIKQLLGPGKSIAIFGIWGLGSYGVQYAKIMGGESTVISLDRSDEKLALAHNCGSDYMINIQNTSNIKDEVMKITAGKGIDVVIDCVGTENTISDSMSY